MRSDAIRGVRIFVERAESQAWRRYNARYDNEFYAKATIGKTLAYANALIDEALAICGSPYHKVTGRRWGEAALGFLGQFGE